MTESQLELDTHDTTSVSTFDIDTEDTEISRSHTSTIREDIINPRKLSIDHSSSSSLRDGRYHIYTWILAYICVSIPLCFAGCIIAIYYIKLCTQMSVWTFAFIFCELLISPFGSGIHFLRENRITQWIARVVDSIRWLTLLGLAIWGSVILYGQVGSKCRAEGGTFLWIIDLIMVIWGYLELCCPLSLIVVWLKRFPNSSMWSELR
jgi:hypothetical protein